MPTTELPSAPFRNREFNGDLLLSELAQLRSSSVSQSTLSATSKTLTTFRDLQAADAARYILRLAEGLDPTEVALARLLKEWARKLKAKPDVVLLAAHFEKLALTSSLLSSLRGLQSTLRNRG